MFSLPLEWTPHLQVEEEFMKDESVDLIRESLNRKSMMG